MNTSQKADFAILRVAYILISLSHKDYKSFRKIAEYFDCFVPGSERTDEFILSAISMTKQLMELKQIYTDEECAKAFLTKILSDCAVIKDDSDATVRKAFVTWLSISLSAKKFAFLGEDVITTLQNFFNAIPSISIFNFALETKEKKITITDEFLKEAEDTYLTMVEVLQQIEKTNNKARKAQLQDYFEITQKDMNNLILTGHN
ncbi:MAG: hypothetical protein PHS31_02130 [Victivallaceae bacterium]|nr:hypothetical protein [Victivallaceae bacterium]